jgi:hypothetical protein
VTLPGGYLDGRDRPGAPPRIDLAYATTGHKARGLTKWTSLPFVTGREDAQWLYVVLSRARHQTRIYTVTGPEERPADLDHVPDNRPPVDGYARLGVAMGRDRTAILASDTRRPVDLRAMATWELRAERDWLDETLATAPRDRHHEATRAAARHAAQEQHVCELRAAGAGNREFATATRRADQASEDARKLRRHQQRAGWLEAHVDLVAERQVVGRELAWRRPARGRSCHGERDDRLAELLGPEPTGDLRQRWAWQAARTAVARLRERTHIRDDRKREAG